MSVLGLVKLWVVELMVLAEMVLWMSWLLVVVLVMVSLWPAVRLELEVRVSLLDE